MDFVSALNSVDRRKRLLVAIWIHDLIIRTPDWRVETVSVAELHNLA